ncbi:MAG: GTPase Era [Aerococcus sp.]|nr:GTPase Era [Aerococcus sp.]
MPEKPFKSGFVAIVGRPNVGKSTLMNRLVGEKIAIMSEKAQTTRNRIQAIYTDEDAQIIFIDTPGIHKPKNELDDYMDQTAYTALEDVDMILMMLNATEAIGPGDRFIMDKIAGLTMPKLLVVNKIDQLSSEDQAAYLKSIPKPDMFQQVLSLSALTGDGVDQLFQTLIEDLPEGPQYYPADQISDHPEYFVVSEMIREQVLQLTREEVPHSVAVTVDSMQRDEHDKVHIYANIIIERNSQKGIIIGKGGRVIKQIGVNARKEIEKLLGTKIYLELFVKVEKNWRNNKARLKEFGYSEKSNY